MAVGKVFLVGAGPGDPELITVKGKHLLQSCDVVVYDYLIAHELVLTLPDHVERHYVGKRAGQHAMRQEEINALLVNLARQGKTVLRLKGGDPFVFGRGAEEAGMLRAHGIPFEIIPGVTSGVAAPAYCGIPCTERTRASTLTIATGHKALDKPHSSVQWETLAKLPHNTLVIYMGVGEMPRILERLKRGGMDPSMPVAVIERGTFPTQRVVTSTLDEVQAACQSRGIHPPALIVVGKAVELRSDLAWFERGPLFGKRILITRPLPLAECLSRALRNLGAEVLPCPTIAVRDVDVPQAWKSLDRISPQAEGWLLFTSENGVDAFMRQFLHRYGDVRRLAGFRLAVIGQGTQAALKRWHLQADFVPSKATVKDFSRAFASEFPLNGVFCVRVRGNLADSTLENALTHAGADLLAFPVYETYFPHWPAEIKEEILHRVPDFIFFTSSSTVNGLAENLNQEERNILFQKCRAVSIGPSTSATLRAYHIDVFVEAEPHHCDGMIEALCERTCELGIPQSS